MSWIRNYLLTLKASGIFGKSLKLERNGDKGLALEKAKEGLELFKETSQMNSLLAGSVLITLTLRVESLAGELEKEGASLEALKAAYLNLSKIEGSQVYLEYKDWLPYIEKKLGYKPEHA